MLKNITSSATTELDTKIFKARERVLRAAKRWRSFFSEDYDSCLYGEDRQLRKAIDSLNKLEGKR